MNLDTLFLQSFVGGSFYFRFPCLEVGPDMYYLFRGKVVAIEGGVNQVLLIVKIEQPHRFTLGEWAYHEQDDYIFYEITKAGAPLLSKYPRFRLISEGVLYSRACYSGEFVLRAPHIPEPDVVEVFEHFEEGYEKLATAFGDLRSRLH